MHFAFCSLLFASRYTVPMIIIMIAIIVLIINIILALSASVYNCKSCIVLAIRALVFGASSLRVRCVSAA